MQIEQPVDSTVSLHVNVCGMKS